MKKLENYRKILAGILITFMVIYPFITYFHVTRPKGMELVYFAKKSKFIVDLFYYNKEVVLFVFAILLLAAMGLGFLTYWMLMDKMPETIWKGKKIWIALGLYFLLNVVSCVFSFYREYGFMGLSIDYEGLAAICGYMVLFAGGFFLFRGKWGEKILIWGVRILSLFLTVGATAELIWGPAFNIEAVQKLLTPERYWHLLENIYLDYNGSVSLTFGNPGFFGGFCSLLFGILAASALTGPYMKFRILDSILAGGLLFDIFASDSSGAFYAAAVTLLIEGILLFRRKFWKNYLQTIGICLVFVLIFLLGIGSLNQGNNLLGNVKDSVVNSQYEKSKDVFTVEKIQLDQGILSVEGQERNFQVEALKDGTDLTVEDFRFTDEKGDEIPLKKGLEAKLSGDYDMISLTVRGRILSLDFGYQDPVELYVQDGLLYYVDFNGSLLSRIPQPVMTSLEQFYPLFTGRGYIWISTIPLLWDVVVLGKGIGTFPFYYPQSEVAGMLNVHGSADYCIEQAHSWYLQTAVSSGILSLACMLYLFGWCFLKGTRDLRKMKTSPCHLEHLLIFGLLAYEIAGLVNNSCIAATPFFWLVLGYTAGKLTKGEITKTDCVKK